MYGVSRCPALPWVGSSGDRRLLAVQPQVRCRRFCSRRYPSGDGLARSQCGLVLLVTSSDLVMLIAREGERVLVLGARVIERAGLLDNLFGELGCVDGVFFRCCYCESVLRCCRMLEGGLRSGEQFFGGGNFCVLRLQDRCDVLSPLKRHHRPVFLPSTAGAHPGGVTSRLPQRRRRCLHLP